MRIPAIVTYVPFDVVFLGERRSFETFRDTVRRISRTDGLLSCARINLDLVNAGFGKAHAVHERLANRFLSKLQLDRVNAWAREPVCVGGDIREPGTAGIFFRAQILDLASWLVLLASDHPDDGATFERAFDRELFVRAAMMVSEMWGATMEASGEVAVTGDGAADRQRAIAVFRKGMLAAHIEPRLALVLSRSQAFYGAAFRQRYPDGDAEYSAATGMSLDEASLLPLGMLQPFLATTPASQQPPLINRETYPRALLPRARRAFEAYQRLISQTPEELAAQLHKLDRDGTKRADLCFDHRAIRARPMLAASRGRSIVLDFSYLAQNAQFGPLFTLTRGNPKANQVFGAFGLAVEEYVHSILTAMYPSSPGLVARLHRNPSANLGHDVVELCDDVVVGHDSLIMIEVKGVFMNDAACGSGAEYIDAVRAKYAASGTSPTADRDLGVAQLARNIRQFAHGDLNPVAPLGLTGKTIFPVLIALDDLFDGPGHQELLAADFRNRLEGEEIEGDSVRIHGTLVRPLTLMTVRDLELLEGSRVPLTQVIREYLLQSFSLGFHNHLVVNQATYGIRESDRLLDEAMATIDRGCVFMFGRTAKETGEPA